MTSHPSTRPPHHLENGTHPQGRFRYLLAFGSNVGDREHNCQRGIAGLAPKVLVQRTSSWIYTQALSSPDYDTSTHDYYLNFVCDTVSDLPPDELYELIYRLENTIGHGRWQKWLPRHLDIDILFWADNFARNFNCCPLRHYHNTQLQLAIPHYAFWQRPFLVDAVTRELGVCALHLRALTSLQQ